MLWLPVTNDTAAFHWRVPVDVRRPVGRAIRQVRECCRCSRSRCAHCSMTRIRLLTSSPGIVLAAVAAAVGARVAASSSRRLVTGAVHLAWNTRLPQSRYAAVSGARSSLTPTASALPSIRRRPGRLPTCGRRCRRSPDAAPPSHGLLLVPEDCELVARRRLRRQAQRDRSGTTRRGPPAGSYPPRRSISSGRRRSRWRTCPAPLRSLPSSRNVPKNHSRSCTIGPPTPRLKSHTLRVTPGVVRPRALQFLACSCCRSCLV